MAKRTETALSALKVPESGIEIAQSAIRQALLGTGRYRQGDVYVIAGSMDVKRRCCHVSMDEMLDWLGEQDHPITVFDFSDWCESRHKLHVVEKGAHGPRTASTD